jgi:hypothetical protein
LLLLTPDPGDNRVIPDHAKYHFAAARSVASLGAEAVVHHMHENPFDPARCCRNTTVGFARLFPTVQNVDGIPVEVGANNPFSARFWLWISLVFPSIFVVQKYLGSWGTAAYMSSVAIALVVAARLFRCLPQGHVRWLAVATFAAVVILFLVVYPSVDTHVPGMGSDDDDAYDVGVTALLTGQSPYAATTYLGNALHQLPGAFLLAVPFVLLGTSAIQNLFWLPLFFLAVTRETGDNRVALHLAWLVLVFSPHVLHQIMTGTGHVSNTIYVLLGLWWLVRTTHHRDVAALAWGVALASRANFLFLVPLASGWLCQHCGWRAMLRATALTCTTVALLTVPLYLHDPVNFGPLEASNRLLRFDVMFPHAGMVLMAIMGVLALGLSVRKMDIKVLFRNCAIVQAFPVVAGFVLSSIQADRLDVTYTAYGTFFGWFVFMALVVQAPKQRNALAASSFA